MKTMRKVALTLATAVLSVGALGITAPAHAIDTNWPCAGCAEGRTSPALMLAPGTALAGHSSSRPETPLCPMV